jgi:hypothetical protein
MSVTVECDIMDTRDIEKIAKDYLKEESIVVFFIEGIFNYEFNDKLFKFLLKKYKKGVYLTADFTAGEIINRAKLQKKQTQKIFFIDCVSEKKNAVHISNAVYTEKSATLFEISEKINDLLNKDGFDFFFIDSIWELAATNPVSDIARFLRYLEAKLKEREVSLIIFSAEKQKCYDLFELSKIKYEKVFVD